jgi:hypothetical protein
MEIPAPPPGSPGMFRCAQPGLIKGIFEKAGFKNVTEKEVPTKLKCGTVDTYWEMLTEIGAPIVAALSKADDATRQKIKEEVFAGMKARYPNEPLEIDAAAMVITGEK